QPKKTRASSSKTKEPLKALGNHPEDEEPINIYEGPYGIYIKYKKINAGLPEGETLESMTLEKALKIIAEKSGSKKTTTKGGTSAKKSTSTTAKKTTRKKSE
ncbi:MAG TPA: topoisomerase C-terminal repeat-containing protein, partial [Allocoleopsis sp.]